MCAVVDLLGKGCVYACFLWFPTLMLGLEYFLPENLLYANILTPILWVGTLLYITFSPPVDTEVVSPSWCYKCHFHVHLGVIKVVAEAFPHVFTH